MTQTDDWDSECGIPTNQDDGETLENLRALLLTGICPDGPGTNEPLGGGEGVPI